MPDRSPDGRQGTDAGENASGGSGPNSLYSPSCQAPGGGVFGAGESGKIMFGGFLKRFQHTTDLAGPTT